jgi:hypothetical protein
MRREIKVDLLEQIVCAESGGWRAAQACCAALRNASSEVLGSTSGPKRDVQRIYEIRLSRQKPEGPPVLGAERILSDLDAYQAEQLTMVVVQDDQEVYCLLLDDAVSRLVTCFVGRDRRDLPTW